MTAPRKSPLPNAAPVLVVAELSLGLGGALLARWLGIPVGERLAGDLRVMRQATAGLAPLLGVLTFAQQTRWSPLVRLRRQVRQIVRSTLAGAQGWELALAALAAGVGEEILFRGALQPWAARAWGEPAALAIVSLLFGVAHAASPAYFLAATAVGAYLGWLAWVCDSLAVPILVHAAYDAIALAWYRRRIDR